MKKIIALLIMIISAYSVCKAQTNIKDYEGGWSGKWKNINDFNFNLAVSRAGSDYIFMISNAEYSFKKNFQRTDDNKINVKIDSIVTFKGSFDMKEKQISGFIQSGKLQYHVVLRASGKNIFTGKWYPLILENIDPGFFVSIEYDSANNKYEAYGFSDDNRYPGFWCYGFEKTNDNISFKDFRTGIHFSGKLLPGEIKLNAEIFGKSITQVTLKKKEDWHVNILVDKKVFEAKYPPQLNDGWDVSDLKESEFNEAYIKMMVDSINANKITNIHSILIAKDGKLIYEQYFQGYNATIPHDMRSASKSISSAITGIAIDKGLLKSTGEKVFELLPRQYRNAQNSDERKSEINIQDLLTMSSGLDAIDFGIDTNSIASEDNYQSTEDWIKTIVEAPVINEPGTHANYGTANPYLLGVVLNEIIKEPLELFIDNNLFKPLGISNYIIATDCFDHPYFGGGMMLTPRDMLKFGQLYLSKGKWKDNVIISEGWVDRSFNKYRILENTNKKNEYGYLWWHHKYKVGTDTIESIEARGAGGQYIFVIPEYNLVAVITSGNFRNGRYWQPEKVMENYILPALGR